LTPHAKRRIDERNLSLEEMKAVIRCHEHKKQMNRGKHGGFVYTFAKTASGRKLVVVAETKKTECWIMTGYYETP
jgi:hypothetical protein